MVPAIYISVVGTQGGRQRKVVVRSTRHVDTDAGQEDGSTEQTSVILQVRFKRRGTELSSSQAVRILSAKYSGPKKVRSSVAQASMSHTRESRRTQYEYCHSSLRHRSIVTMYVIRPPFECCSQSDEGKKSTSLGRKRPEKGGECLPVTIWPSHMARKRDFCDLRCSLVPSHRRGQPAAVFPRSTCTCKSYVQSTRFRLCVSSQS